MDSKSKFNTLIPSFHHLTFLFIFTQIFKMSFLKYIIVFTFMVLATTVGAQKFNGGVLGGLSTSEVSGDRLEGPNKAGAYLGVFVNRYFSERSSVQMELDFIQKGSKENPDSANSYESYLLKLNYIEIPIHYKYDFHKKGTLETGLSLGFLVSEKELANGYPWVEANEFNRVDFCFNIGAYYRIFPNLLINVRYSNSILAIRPHTGETTYKWNKGQYNEVLSFTFHYIIPGFSR